MVKDENQMWASWKINSRIALIFTWAEIREYGSWKINYEQDGQSKSYCFSFKMIENVTFPTQINSCTSYWCL